MEQWVSRVRALSSQYNNGTWAAHQVTGPPKVYPRYGDINGAWAQSGPDANEYLEVRHLLLHIISYKLICHKKGLTWINTQSWLTWLRIFCVGSCFQFCL